MPAYTGQSGGTPEAGDENQKKKLIVLLILIAVMVIVWLLVLVGPSSIAGAVSGGEEMARETDDSGDRAAEPAPEQPRAAPPIQGEGQEEIPSMETVDELIADVQTGIHTDLPLSPPTFRSPFDAPWLGEQTRQKPDQGETEQEGKKPAEKKQAERLAEVRDRLRRQLHLNGILYDEKDPLALINGRATGEKEPVGEGIRVQKITPTSVVLSFTYNQAEHELTLELKEP